MPAPSLTDKEKLDLKNKLVLDNRQNPLTGRYNSLLGDKLYGAEGTQTNVMRFADKPFGPMNPTQEFKSVLESAVIIGQSTSEKKSAVLDGPWVAAVKAIIVAEIDNNVIKTNDEGLQRMKDFFELLRKDVEKECKSLANSHDEKAIEQKISTIITTQSIYMGSALLKMEKSLTSFNEKFASEEKHSNDAETLEDLIDYTLKVLKDAKLGGDPKLIAMSVMAHNAIEAACNSYIKGEDPKKCVDELAAQICAIKDATKHRFTGKSSPEALFSNALLDALTKAIYDYKNAEENIPKVKIDDKVKTIVETIKTFQKKSDDRPSMMGSPRKTMSGG